MARKKTLHDLHADANTLAAQALNVFRSVADDLHLAARGHEEVANQAQAVADHHAVLAEQARLDAAAAVRQAEAVQNLVK